MAGEQFVVITGPEDAQEGHVPFVTPHMDGENLVIVDPAPATIAGEGLSYIVRNDRAFCVYNDIVLDRVAGVWDRRPTMLDRSMFDRVHPDCVKYSWSAVREHSKLFYGQFQDALWISDNHAIQRAENKALQLHVAQQVGFNVPSTLITSDPQRAEDFVKSNKMTVIKGLASETPIINDTWMLAFSKVVTPDTRIDFRHLRYAPAIFQKAIDTAYDLRVSVVGNYVFPAMIMSDAESGISGLRDWRIGNHLGNLSIKEYELPEDIQEMCINHVKRLRLKFGAIDMIRDKHGAYWFVENNPNGQWAFVEEETGQPIGQAIARLLLSGRSR